MKTVGIIAEYNPFHNGHLYQMLEAKKKSGADYVVVAMSPDFVQRGEPAFTDKWVRAAAALECGADLVLELPARVSSGSAEYFAHGAVSLLDSLGCVDALSFGCEKAELWDAAEPGDAAGPADIKVLMEAASFFSAPESSEYKEVLRAMLAKGKTYAQARTDSYAAVSPGADPDGLLRSPNNILAVEYIKSLMSLGSSMSPVPVPRAGAGYNDLSLPRPETDVPDKNGPGAGSPGTALYASASGIRSAIAGGTDVSQYMPDASFAALSSEMAAGRYVFPSDIDLLLHASLIRNAACLEEFQDVSADLANRIRNLIGEYTGFEQFSHLLKTKQIALSRVRRCLIHVLLGIKKNGQPAEPAYARIMGFRRSAQPLLHVISENSAIPLVTKLPPAERLLPGMEEDLRATLVWEMIVCHKTGKPVRSERQRQLIIM